MQRRSKNGQRPRVGVSLDDDVYEWIQTLDGPSDSYKVSRVVRAAMLAGLTIDEAQSAGILEDLTKWLGKQKKQSKVATEMHELLEKYLSSKRAY
jgi:hypothetical protein